MRTACFARAPQRYTSRLSKHFLLTFQEVTPPSKTRNQLNFKGIMKAAGLYHEVRWNVPKIEGPCEGYPLSWQDGHDAYRQALTSPSEPDRRFALIRTFKALGGVMHLIQDLSNPAHARNDDHYNGAIPGKDWRVPGIGDESFHAWGARPDSLALIRDERRMPVITPAPVLLDLIDLLYLSA